ncbi:hypothetical protein EXS70_04155, partial [Candidatus Peribacteria bacterium]|nr:hypothetical protein [Candidatus Peribacteria bacterium]
MSTPDNLHRQIDAIREYLKNLPATGEMAGALRSEKQQWVRAALEQVGYEQLAREDRGLVRQYIQHATGYSRAQMERHISAYRETVAAQVPAMATADASATSTDAQAPSGPAGQAYRTHARALFLAGAATALVLFVRQSGLLTGSVLKIAQQTQQQVTQQSVIQNSYPAIPQPTWFNAVAPSPLSTRITLRRTVRLFSQTAQKIELAQPTINVNVPTQIQYRKQLVASLMSISGKPGEGKIVMFRNGKAVWENLPSDILRVGDDGRLSGGLSRPTQSGSSARRGGGGGGGGGSAGGSTTNITNNTTTTGLNQTAADALYVNLTGDTMTGNLSVVGNLSGSTFTVSSLQNCDTVDTDATGNFICGSDSVGSGVFSQSSTDLRYVQRQGSSMSGGLLIQSGTLHGTLPTIEAGLLLEVAGTASGRVFHAQDQLRSSGTLIVEGASIFQSTVTLNGVTYTFPYGDGAASGRVLKTNGAGQLSWSTDIDTDTNTTYTAGQGLTLNGTTFSTNSILTGSLIRFSTLSGITLFAKSQIRSSGSLVVDTTSLLKGNVITRGNFSGATLTATSLKNCDTIDTDSAGNLVCGSDSTGTANTFGSGNVITLTSNRYVEVQGDTMTGGLMIVSGGHTGLPT